MSLAVDPEEVLIVRVPPVPVVTPSKFPSGSVIVAAVEVSNTFVPEPIRYAWLSPSRLLITGAVFAGATVIVLVATELLSLPSLTVTAKVRSPVVAPDNVF